MTAYRRKDNGRWMIKIKIKGMSPICRVSPVQTKHGAERYEREVRAAIDEGRWGTTGGDDDSALLPVPTLAEWIEPFIEQHSLAVGLKPSSIKDQRQKSRLYLIPLIGNVKVDALRKQHFLKVRGAMAKQSLANKTINNALAVLSRAVRFWYESRDLPVPSFRGVRTKVPKSPPKFWEPAEYKALLRAAANRGPEELAMVLLMGDCGLRVGEVLALEWDHVRWRPTPQLEIQQSIVEGHLGPPKNGRPRTVPMTPKTQAALQSVVRNLAAPWVFTTTGKDGKVTNRTASSIARALWWVEHDAGLEPSPNTKGQCHKLRHTFCTRLAMAGVPPRVILELAGHQDLQTTMRYMHVVSGAIHGAIHQLGAFDDVTEDGEGAPNTVGHRLGHGPTAGNEKRAARRV